MDGVLAALMTGMKTTIKASEEAKIFSTWVGNRIANNYF
ncbi:MAG: hypothetical protein ACD_35C00046G0003 [uncultured bacterium]|nr:MAG: hypothetical protein ACD_35C00046G0003 [uncultured bacterium]